LATSANILTRSPQILLELNGADVIIKLGIEALYTALFFDNPVTREKDGCCARLPHLATPLAARDLAASGVAKLVRQPCPKMPENARSDHGLFDLPIWQLF
jgi:hypothetical protein